MEQKRKARENIFHPNNLFYNADDDFYVCPMGQRMQRCGITENVSDLGYVSYSARYSAVRCDGCPLRGGCFKALGNRTMEVNHSLNEHKAYARELLTSERGLYHRSMRPIEPEAVFGQIKAGHMFRRFALRSLAKVNVEFGLIAVAHNLRKWVAALSAGHIFDNYRYISVIIDPNKAFSTTLNPNYRIAA
ncbi:MAG: transposase [Rikenellaceae bacterium]